MLLQFWYQKCYVVLLKAEIGKLVTDQSVVSVMSTGTLGLFRFHHEFKIMLDVSLLTFYAGCESRKSQFIKLRSPIQEWGKGDHRVIHFRLLQNLYGENGNERLNNAL